MENIMGFADAVMAWMDRREVTEEDIRFVMGDWAVNTVHQMTRGRCSFYAVTRFLNQLLACGYLPIEEEDADQLRDALHSCHINKLNDMAIKSIKPLLYLDQGETDAAIPLAWYGGGDNAPSTLEDMIALWGNAVQAEVLIINLPIQAFFEALSRVRDTGCDLHVEHFFSLDASAVRAANVTRALMPMLLRPNYEGLYQTDLSSVIKPHMAFMYNRAVARLTFEDGHIETHMLVQTLNGLYTGYADTGDGSLYTYLYETFATHSGDFRSLRSAPLSDSPVCDLAGIVQELYEMENGRELLFLRPDLSTPFITPDALWDALIPEYISDNESHAAELYRLHTLRYDNLRSANVTLVMRMDAMRRFVRTGRTSDHPFMMKSFTPEQRVQILESLSEINRDNPRFQLNFWQEDLAIRPLCFTCYAGLGVRVTRIGNDRNTSNGYADAFLAVPEFATMFDYTYSDEIMAHRIINCEQSAAWLELLLSDARRLAAADGE